MSSFQQVLTCPKAQPATGLQKSARICKQDAAHQQTGTCPALCSRICFEMLHVLQIPPLCMCIAVPTPGWNTASQQTDAILPSKSDCRNDAQENIRTLQGDAAFLQVSLSHQQEVRHRLDSYIAESRERLEANERHLRVTPTSTSVPILACRVLRSILCPVRMLDMSNGPCAAGCIQSQPHTVHC